VRKGWRRGALDGEVGVQHAEPPRLMKRKSTLGVIESEGEKNPMKETVNDEELKERVEAVLDKIRPYIAMDGGFVDLVEVKEGVVTVRMGGACSGCSMAMITLRNGISAILKEEIPEVEGVEAIFTDIADF
jgi:Fe-S cluster biogenesis protein NfuA